MAIKKIITIGRSGGSDYRVDSESVSNEHAMLIVSDRGKCLLIDCASTNGTRLPSKSGAESISQAEVKLDHVVFFGKNEHRIRDIVSIRSNASAAESGDDFTRFRDPVDGSIKRKPR